MAMRNYVTHPADNSPEVAHVVAGALQVQEINPQNVQGEPYSARTATFKNVNGTPLPLLSIQHAGVGALSMLLRQLEVYCDGKGIAAVDLVHGGTLTAPTFAAITGSDFELDTAATGITGGRVIASMFVGRDTTGRLLDNLNSALLINSAAPGPLSVVVANIDGDVDVLGTLSWLEK